jgi:hypothetical protein
LFQQLGSIRIETVETTVMDFIELNSDQRREMVNARQRYQAWREAAAQVRAHRGSMVWSNTKGRDYLIRAAYDKHARRRQSSLGLRSPETERIKAEFERARDQAAERLEQLGPVLARQAAVNRALGLGRVPLLGARIIRALDASGLLGAGIRILGNYGLYAYEAVAGVQIDPGLTTTEDIDLLLDARGRVSIITPEDFEPASLMRILRRVDRSFVRSSQNFRAVNRDGFLVDLIKPLRNPPWTSEPAKVGDDPDDLAAVEITGLAWHESAPPFDSTAIDERGEPLRIVTSDPRIFVAHKHWMSKRPDREPVKRLRDREQAGAVAALVAAYLPHLPFVEDELRMLPRDLVEETKPLFEPPGRRP